MSGPMKVLLTGGTGFLGQYLLAQLLERGHSVWSLYRSESRKLDTIKFLSSLNLPEARRACAGSKAKCLKPMTNGKTGAESVKGSKKWTLSSTVQLPPDCTWTNPANL